PAALLALAARGDGALRQRDRAGEVVAAQRLLRGRQVEPRGPSRVAALLVMRREDGGVQLALLLEERPGEAMASAPVGVGDHRVGRVAHERVAEGVLLVVRDGRAVAARDELSAHQPVEGFTQALGGLAEERGEAAPPEGLPEDARG